MRYRCMLYNLDKTQKQKQNKQKKTQKHYAVKETSHKKPILYNPIYMKYPE